MGIEFDDVAASRLLTCLTDAALGLRASGAGRRASAETALRDFHGAYARLFEAARTIESEDRVRLTRALEDLAVQLHVVNRQADEERRRQEARAAWQERERGRDRALLTVGAPLRPTLDWSSCLWDPEPADTPVRPTPLTASFRARTRPRSSGGGGSGAGGPSGAGGRSGADPRRLREFSGSAHVQDAATEQDLTRVRNAWAGFTSRCSWVPVDEATLVVGFGDYLAENAEDAAWAARIADAFAAAGGRVCLANGTLDVAGTSTLPAALRRALDPSATPAEVAAAWRGLGLSEHDLRALPPGDEAADREPRRRPGCGAGHRLARGPDRRAGEPGAGVPDARATVHLRGGGDGRVPSAGGGVVEGGTAGGPTGAGTRRAVRGSGAARRVRSVGRGTRRCGVARGPRHGVKRHGERTGRNHHARQRG
ncbi:hypothetical protein DEJ36_14665 [Curtobacterium sp. MCPF17_052]|nr:hypothetical protein [Curtobacterium sp. MCPF17_052]WIB12041.1 hypothetical protein DEJ36_14665 [Curtobacterium sp. MCPF17_052]